MSYCKTEMNLPGTSLPCKRRRNSDPINPVFYEKNAAITAQIATLQNLHECGIITKEEMQNQIQQMEDKRLQILELVHPYSIKPYTAKDGKGRKERTRWTTRLPDASKAGGYRWVRTNDREELIQILLEHYGLNNLPGMNDKPDTSLAGLYEKWIPYRLANVDAATVKKDKANWKRYYEGDPITKIELDKIKPSEAKIWLSDKVKSMQLTQRQYIDMKGIWNQIEDFAFGDNLISRRLIIQLGSPQKSLFKPTEVRFKETETLSLAELIQFKETAMQLYEKSHFNTAYLGIILAASIGVRVGELSCLKWDGLDRKNKILLLSQSETPKYYVDGSSIRNAGYEVDNHLKKNHRIRPVPLPEEAEEIMDFIRAENAKMGILSEYVFVQKNGDRVHTRSFQKAIRKVFTILGWSEKHGGVHEFRRTYATSLLEAGISDKKVQRWMGHKDFTTTKRYYDYTSKQPDEEAEADVSRAIWGRKKSGTVPLELTGGHG